YYEKEFESLALDALARMRALEDDSGAELLCSRVIRTLPESERLNKALIAYLMERKDEVAIIRHVSRLNQMGAPWVAELRLPHGE
ncbi:MAG: hypothetical protein PUB51_02085, partial [Oscillospiraceae bacterium]|nr:hypothetical protein [Oscillospiraceae bacterium]